MGGKTAVAERKRTIVKAPAPPPRASHGPLLRVIAVVAVLAVGVAAGWFLRARQDSSRCAPRDKATGVNWSGCKLDHLVMVNERLDDSDLSGISLAEGVLHDSSFIDTNLRGADLHGANLAGADLIGADLTGANLAGADLSGADLSSSNERSTNLTNADLTGANLSDSDLSDAIAKNTKFGGASLSETTFDDADLTGADLNNTTFRASASWSGTKCPDGTTAPATGC